MAGLGTIFVELQLDRSKFNTSLQTLERDATSVPLQIEKSFANLGIKSSYQFDLMRQKAVLNYDAIKSRAEATANDIYRAEVAKNEQLRRLDEEQYGRRAKLAENAYAVARKQIEDEAKNQPQQLSRIESLKANWIAASVAITAAWMSVNKAVSYMDQGGKAMQIESSFKIMADAAGVSSEKMIESMKAATKQTIDDSQLMQKAVKLMTLGYDTAQIERFSNVVITASQISGTTAAQAYDELADAIGNRTPKAMVRMGAVTREQMKIVTEAITAGADSSVLFELAMANLEAKQKMLQGTQDEATIALQRFHAQVNETTEAIGKGLIWAAQRAYGAFQLLSGGVVGTLGSLASLSEWVARGVGLTTFANQARDAADAARISSKDLLEKGAANMMGTADVAEKASKKEIEAAKAVVDAQMEKIKAIAGAKDAQKKAEEEAKQTITNAERAAKSAVTMQQAVASMQGAAATAMRGGGIGGGTSFTAYADLDAIQEAGAAQLAEMERTQARLRGIMQGYLARGLMQERDYREKVREMDADLTAAKLQNLQAYQSAAISALGKALSEYAKYTADVKKLDEQIADSKRSTEDMLAGLKQAGMTPAEAAADKERRANEALADALTKSGQEQVEALRRVQAAYKDLGMESVKSAADQKEAAKQAWATDRPMDDWRTTPGKQSEAFKQAWSQTTPGGVGSSEWWAGKGNTYWGASSTTSTPQSAAEKMASKVQEVGDLIVKAQEQQRNAAASSARQADRMVESMTTAANEAARLSASLASAQIQSQSSGGDNIEIGALGQLVKRTGPNWIEIADMQNAANDIVSQIRAVGSGNSGGNYGEYTGSGGTNVYEGPNINETPTYIDEGYASGGVVPGVRGAPRLATVHGGEVILNESQQSGGATILIQLDGRSIAQAVKVPMQDLIRSGQIQIRAN